jgi:hypothetical protein
LLSLTALIELLSKHTSSSESNAKILDRLLRLMMTSCSLSESNSILSTTDFFAFFSLLHSDEEDEGFGKVLAGVDLVDGLVAGFDMVTFL